MEDKSSEKNATEVLTWLKPQVRRLEIAVDTQDPPKDTSFEDSFVRGAGWPERK